MCAHDDSTPDGGMAEHDISLILKTLFLSVSFFFLFSSRTFIFFFSFHVTLYVSFFLLTVILSCLVVFEAYSKDCSYVIDKLLFKVY